MRRFVEQLAASPSVAGWITKNLEKIDGGSVVICRTGELKLYNVHSQSAEQTDTFFRTILSLISFQSQRMQERGSESS
jgi:hypothetical protein